MDHRLFKTTWLLLMTLFVSPSCSSPISGTSDHDNGTPHSPSAVDVETHAVFLREHLYKDLASDLFSGVFKKIQEKTSVLWKCTIEEHECLSNLNEFRRRWERTTGEDANSDSYKPKNDVTFQNRTGRYMYAAARNRDASSLAVMWTEWLVLIGHENICVEFWFHMDGPDDTEGDLWLYKSAGNETKLIWESAGELESGWRRRHINMTIGKMENELRLGFISDMRGRENAGTAIDDVIIAPGFCQPDADSNLVGEWGEWGPCSVTAGMGARSRKRKCSAPTCATETEFCSASEEGTDSWSSWSECSVTCGNGYRYRTKGSDTQTELCSSDSCEDESMKPKTSSCGIRPSEGSLENIIGGQEARRNSWPWQVLFEVKTSWGSRAICGGTIISPRYVIAAAHCYRNSKLRLEASDILIRVGAHYRFDGEKYDVKRVILHHHYVAGQVHNDVLIVEMKNDIAFSPTVSALCLPEEEIQPGKTCYATGWGKTQFPEGPSTTVLHEVKLKIIDRQTCRMYLPIIRLGHLCVGEDTSRKGVFKGDSGGPLACEKDGKYYLAGVASFVHAMKLSPDVFTNVYRYREWIRENTGL